VVAGLSRSRSRTKGRNSVKCWNASKRVASLGVTGLLLVLVLCGRETPEQSCKVIVPTGLVVDWRSTIICKAQQRKDAWHLQIAGLVCNVCSIETISLHPSPKTHWRQARSGARVIIAHAQRSPSFYCAMCCARGVRHERTRLIQSFPCIFGTGTCIQLQTPESAVPSSSYLIVVD